MVSFYLNRKSKKSAKLDTVIKELSESKALNVQLMEDLEKARETIAALQTSLTAPRSVSSDVNSEEFIADMRPSSTHRAGRQGENTNAEITRFMSSVNQISVSSISVPECKPSSGLDEIGRHDFESWRDLLTDSFKLAGVADEATQYIIFKVKAGQKLLDIFKNTRNVENAPDEVNFPFSNAMYRLKTYFSSASDVMLQRRKLALITQKQDESDVSFLMRIGAVARMCEFGDDKEFEEIVRAVAEHASNRDVRTMALKLLSRKGTFTDLVDKVRELETIRLNEEFFHLKHGKTEPATIARVAAAPATQFTGRGGLQRRNETFGRGRYHGQQSGYRGALVNRGRNASAWRGETETPERCFRCHSLFHKSFNCSAINMYCLKCGGKGHLQRACRSMVREDDKNRQAERSSEVRQSEVAAIVKTGEDTPEKSSEHSVSDVA